MRSAASSWFVAVFVVVDKKTRNEGFLCSSSLRKPGVDLIDLPYSIHTAMVVDLTEQHF